MWCLLIISIFGIFSKAHVLKHAWGRTKYMLCFLICDLILVTDWSALLDLSHTDNWAACLKGSLLCHRQAHDIVKALWGRAASLWGTFADIDTEDCSSCGQHSELIKFGFGLDWGMCCDLFLKFKISHVIFQMWNQKVLSKLRFQFSCPPHNEA